MKRKLVVTLVVTLTLGLILTLALAYAQGPERETSEEEAGSDIGGLGLGDPPPPDYSVLYMFTGVANDNTGQNQVATVVHCTNFGTTPTTIGVEFFLNGGSITGFNPYTDTLTANKTGTYSTQPTFFGGEVPLNTGIIQQGSGRILYKEHPQVICTAQILEPGTITPTFMAKLPLFDSQGNRVGSIRHIFLPVILKQ